MQMLNDLRNFGKKGDFVQGRLFAVDKKDLVFYWLNSCDLCDVFFLLKWILGDFDQRKETN